MTYRIVDVASNTRIGDDIVSENTKLAVAKARMFARLAGGAFSVRVLRNCGEWIHVATITERPTW